jgi:hypothetical protein
VRRRFTVAWASCPCFPPGFITFQNVFSWARRPCNSRARCPCYVSASEHWNLWVDWKRVAASRAALPLACRMGWERPVPPSPKPTALSLPPSRFIIPAKGLVANRCNWAFEIATAYFIGLAMTCKRLACHCEEQSDEAISPLATSPKAGIQSIRYVPGSLPSQG